ncbi:hypothetical protein Gotur_033889 [Gossypium turneri]
MGSGVKGSMTTSPGREKMAFNLQRRASTSSPVRIRDYQTRLRKKKFRVGKEDRALEEEKMHLGLDVDIHKLEAEKLRRGITRLKRIWIV